MRAAARALRDRALAGAILAAAALGCGCSTILDIDGDWTEKSDTSGAGATSATTTGTPGSASGSTSGGGATGAGATGSSASGTASASGSGGASSASSGAGGTGGGGGGCPAGVGPAMVDLGPFCIDSTEVTNDQYLAFLNAGVATQSATGQPAYCSWNTTYLPETSWPPMPGQLDLPVGNVNWCDAYAYCGWAGKRMCGAIGGGSADFALAADQGQQWYYACANALDTTVYTYGDVYDPVRCNGGDSGAGAVVPVASLPGCHGVSAPFAGVFDLTGNAREWEDSCNAQVGASDMCRRRGGSYFADQAGLTCDALSFNSSRSNASPSSGIRCCSP